MKLATRFDLRRWILRCKAKYYTMKKTAVKDQLYGGLVEMMNNSSLFHKSDIGGHHEYSRWTDAGRTELAQFMDDISRKILIAEDQELDSRAKKMVIDNLKAK